MSDNIEEHLSFSQINQWLGCQAQYSYQRIENIEAIDVGSSLVVGTAYHAAVEMFYRAKMNGDKPVNLNEMVAVFEQVILEEESENIIQWGKSSRNDEARKAEGIFKAFLDGQEDNEVLAVEHMFKLDLADLPPIIGRMDLIERGRDGHIRGSLSMWTLLCTNGSWPNMAVVAAFGIAAFWNLPLEPPQQVPL